MCLRYFACSLGWFSRRGSFRSDRALAVVSKPMSEAIEAGVLTVRSNSLNTDDTFSGPTKVKDENLRRFESR